MSQNRYTTVVQAAEEARARKDAEYQERYLESMFTRDGYYMLLTKNIQEMFPYLSKHQYHKK